MATVTVRNLPDDLVTRIKERAAMNEHSMEQELREMLSRQFPGRAEVFRAIEASRRRRKLNITAAEIDSWRRVGRP